MKSFENIAEFTIQSAEKVPCSLEEFVAGLQDIVDALNERIAVSVEELKWKCEDEADRMILDKI